MQLRFNPLHAVKQGKRQEDFCWQCWWWTAARGPSKFFTTCSQEDLLGYCVTQPPIHALLHKKVPARPRAATPACAAQSLKSGESFPSLSLSPPDTPSNLESNAGDSVVSAVSLDGLSMPNSQCWTAAHDVWHLFEKGDRRLNRKSVCRFCMCVPSTLCFTLLSLKCYEYSKNIAANFKKYGKINYKYAPATGISNLCHHIECHHVDEYKKICEEKKWPMMLVKQRAIDEQSSQGLWVSPAADASRPAFSAKNLIHALVKFIVTDNQVHDWFSASMYSNTLAATVSQYCWMSWVLQPTSTAPWRSSGARYTPSCQDLWSHYTSVERLLCGTQMWVGGECHIYSPNSHCSGMFAGGSQENQFYRGPVVRLKLTSIFSTNRTLVGTWRTRV